MARRTALLLLAAVAAACGGGPGGGIAGGPAAPAHGRPTGLGATAAIGGAGGSVALVASDGGQLELRVPAGAVSVAQDFTIDEIAVSGLIGAVGSGYRLSHSGAAPSAGVTLVFTPAAPADPAALTAAYQGSIGYWSRVYSAARDAASVSVTTTFFGDWSLVTVATQLDLHGPFRLDSTEGLPFTAEGNVTLQYLADGAYLPQGDIALTAVPCGAPPPGAELPASIAELSATYFRWGINGQWTLSCGFVSTNFDSLGITNIGCTRSYTAAMPVRFDAAHVSGQYVIDCGAAGQVVASWDLVPPDQTTGALPPP